jgi:hypothetical protein
MTIKKRGRPAGSKNKVLILKDKDNRSEISNFAETLAAWDRMEAENPKPDWELIAKKQEERLTAYIAENEELAKICIMRWEEIQHLKYLVTYLEGKHEDSSV